jgi:hypothetical protein
MELEAGPDCEPIEIRSRKSDRVPFGTGAAVNKITGYDDPVKEFRFYDPAVFEMLGLWLQCLPGIWQSRSSELNLNMFPGAPFDRRVEDQNQFENQLSLLSALKKMRTESALDHAFRQSKDLDQFTRQTHTWFDAFRTLKLIHYIRDERLPSISYSILSAHQIFSQLLTQDVELLAFHKQNAVEFR